MSRHTIPDPPSPSERDQAAAQSLQDLAILSKPASAAEAFAALERALRAEALDAPAGDVERILSYRTQVLRLAEPFGKGLPQREPRQPKAGGVAVAAPLNTDVEAAVASCNKARADRDVVRRDLTASIAETVRLLGALDRADAMVLACDADMRRLLDAAREAFAAQSDQAAADRAFVANHGAGN